MAMLWRSLPRQFFAVHLKFLPTVSRYSDNIIDRPDMGPPIPPYQKRQGETTDVKKARLLYQSRKRGMLENGLLLSTFAEGFLTTSNEKLLDQYDTLINEPTNDWDIYYWMTGVKETPEKYENEVMKMLKKHAQNEHMEERIRQPDLKF
ncbi:succinate dehydrogenase assembly factor 2, mitochondrial-like [Dendronephthya gigantea]|uniref:succinate dehydrogenase assembly factor 2, mitochondrial-like n=1 Tax=Dendronephthya gigantea TaxID=151771 RepID=UPI00106D27F3|nr:succinate dehydrogenase assembly factor 2, mitochondrial-like [Dendronephthya gigantea]